MSPVENQTVRTSQAPSQGILASPFLIVAVAFALRLFILYLHSRHPFAAETPGRYGYETGLIAASLAAGKGFSSPLPNLDTGATAWLSPIYPLLVAGIFRLWGIFSSRSLIVIQILNSLFSALTIFPIYAATRRTFSIGLAVVSSWLWVIFPNAWHVPIADIWDTSLTAPWFALLFLATIALRDEKHPMKWAGYGLLWAIGALINASMLAVFPFFLLWLAWQARERSLPWLRLSAAAALLFVLGIAPWTARNYLAFGKIIPIRSNFAFELWLGNNPNGADWKFFGFHPAENQAEAAEYARLGEIAYIHSKGRIVEDYIRSHPARMLRATFQRAVSYWLAVSDRPGALWSANPPYLKALFVMNATMIFFCCLGVGVAWREGNPFAPLYLIVLIFFPLIFYITHPLARYRFPIEPITIVLALYGISSLGARRMNGGMSGTEPSPARWLARR